MSVICPWSGGVEGAGGVRKNHRLRFACRVCLELGIDDPEAWLDSISERTFDVWWAYYQCEPFGSHWEQTASLAAVVHANTAMMAATRGVKLEPMKVVDFVPSDSMRWMKRTRSKAGGIRHPKTQKQILKRAFGFT